MSKLFHDHLTIREDITAELDLYSLDPLEREEVVSLVDEILNHHILNLIFNHLPKEHHAEFTRLLHTSPHDPALLDFVKSKVTVDIDSEITTHAQKIKKDILAEIKKSSRRK